MESEISKIYLSIYLILISYQYINQIHEIILPFRNLLYIYYIIKIIIKFIYQFNILFIIENIDSISIFIYIFSISHIYWILVK